MINSIASCIYTLVGLLTPRSTRVENGTLLRNPVVQVDVVYPGHDVLVFLGHHIGRQPGRGQLQRNCLRNKNNETTHYGFDHDILGRPQLRVGDKALDYKTARKTRE